MRAFNAAEAGIESALHSGTGAENVAVTSGVSYSVNVASIGGNSGVYEMARKTMRGATEHVWLVEHDEETGDIIETPFYTGNLIAACWTSENSPAMVITIVYKEGTDSSYQTKKISVDGNVSRRAQNNFIAPTAVNGGCGKSGYSSYRIYFSDHGITTSGVDADTVLALRIRPEYADASLAVNSPSIIPKQGNIIESVGTTDGGVSRKVVVYQQYRSAPSIFDYGIYSQSSFSH